ncbi:DUF5675 family protein [candidate division KSB1 bacterium]|nr:DUF5675 family protein [candidate division KSB1 bacterium]
MELQLVRKWLTENSTIGELSVNGAFECFTLEDVVRPEKIPGITAIAPGRYEIAVTFSNRFQKYLPLLLNVPDFQGVRIHPGNRPEDTEGCILVGQIREENSIGNSRLAFDALFAKIQAVTSVEKIFIEITSQG